MVWADDMLVPEYGTIFQEEGSIHLSPQVLTLNFLIKFNDYDWPSVAIPPSLNSTCHESSSEFIKQICRHQLPSLASMIDRYDMWREEITGRKK